jgi:hypothetical protein
MGTAQDDLMKQCPRRVGTPAVAPAATLVIGARR